MRSDATCGAPVLRAFLDNPKIAPDAACTRRRTPPVFVTSLIRAPSVARELAGMAAGLDFMTAPTASALLLALAYLFFSSAIWSVVGFTRIARLGAGAVARFWTRPGTPLGIAAVAIGATPVLAAAVLVESAGTMSPILLMIGLPSSAILVFALPWIAVLCLGWGGWALLSGEDRAERPAAYAIHLWLTFAVAIAAIALLAAFGLLLPEAI